MFAANQVIDVLRVQTVGDEVPVLRGAKRLLRAKLVRTVVTYLMSGPGEGEGDRTYSDYLTELLELLEGYALNLDGALVLSTPEALGTAARNAKGNNLVARAQGPPDPDL